MNKVAVYGGLGNQMFQYAFCTALNKQGAKTRLSFNCYFYFKHHNGFDLARAFKLNLPPQQAFLSFILEHGTFLYRNKLVAGAIRRLAIWQEQRQQLYREQKEFVTDPAVFQQQQTLFYGTWQSEEYFHSIADHIQQQFVFNTPHDERNKAVIEKINASNAVSIHIRRGDYLKTHWQSSLNVIKDLTYYKNAVAHIESHVSNPAYFIFSDDMEWVKENLPLANCTYVDHNKGKQSYIDMYLMSQCRHNIIANSTFSWWGAWLNKNKSKIVIMPERWMNDNECPGIFPQHWIKMPV
jgi:Glycosyl transferase family 11